MPERLVRDDPHACRDGHEFRYRLAAGFVDYGTVLDAACGTGYGRHLMAAETYYGVDIDLSDLEVSDDDGLIEADLCEWAPDFAYDTFVSFETIEHLESFAALIAAAKRARRWAILSVPVVPTKRLNPHHLHDFERGDLARLMVDDRWRLYQTVAQPSELSEISVFERIR